MCAKKTGEKKETWVTDKDGRIVRKDTTEYYDDGDSIITHQEADGGGLLHGPSAGRITGKTWNKSDGTSKHTPK